jgi:PAS domain S-box-containing protein
MSSDRFAGLKPAVRGMDTSALQRADNFISLRWRLLVPLFAIILTFAMIVTYLVTGTLVQQGQTAQFSQIALAGRGAQDGMAALYADLQNEATRIAYLQGMTTAFMAGDGDTLRRLLEPEAAYAGLDSVIVLDASGTEVLGLQRSAPNRRSDYVTSSGASMADQPLVLALRESGRAGASGVMRTPDGYLLYVGQPIIGESGPPGYVLVGVRLTSALDALRSSSLTQVALYSGGANLLQATFQPDDTIFEMLTLTPEQVQQTLQVTDQLPAQSLTIAGYPYQAAYLPFIVGVDTLGVLGVYLPSSLPYAADLSRQLLSLLMASMAAVLVIAGYAGVSRTLSRMQRVTATTRALARGDHAARTTMAAHDEIGEMGASLDVYADRVQQRQDALRAMLRRQRRENARLTAILESMPDGIVVQDLDGRVLLMNDCARDLLGSQHAQQTYRRNIYSELTAMVTDVLGPALAPGIYTLGTPQRIPLAGKVLSAQAAAILTISGRRVGTVVVLRDITVEIQREQAREDMLNNLARDVQEPLLELVALRSSADADPALQRFAYEVMRNAVRLQRLMMQIRDLSDLGPDELEVGQRPLRVDGILDALAEEWRGTIMAADLTLDMVVHHREVYVLGDERRLRWALGNLLDNAVKYTPAGGTITLAARRPSENHTEIIIRDTGVGISARDKPHIFDRFQRGTPLLPDGTLLRVPGMGQGLYIAKRVIEAHGGQLDLKSRPQQGTIVTCALPLTAPLAMPLDRQPGTVPDRLPGELAPVRRDRDSAS